MRDVKQNSSETNLARQPLKPLYKVWMIRKDIGLLDLHIAMNYLSLASYYFVQFKGHVVW